VAVAAILGGLGGAVQGAVAAHDFACKKTWISWECTR
jgi:hypothetical protein